MCVVSQSILWCVLFCVRFVVCSWRNILCGICEAQHITKYADHWCPECDENLCSDCQNHHNISRASRNHGVISIENYHQLPSYISEIGNRICLIWSWNICRCFRISNKLCCLFFVMLSILFLISVKFCSMLSINVDVLDVLLGQKSISCYNNFLRIQSP
jgi:hypothetical protein